MKIVKILDTCILPVKITNGSSTLEVTSYNESCVLYYNMDGKPSHIPTKYLSGFDLVNNKETVELYKYNVKDTLKGTRISSDWTTETFENYYRKVLRNVAFELMSTETREVKL